METSELASWEDFSEWLREIDRVHTNREARSPASVSKRLFRGQADSTWGLETTLERRVGGPIAVAVYASLVEQLVPEVSSLTDRRWPEFRAKLSVWKLVAGMQSGAPSEKSATH